MCGGYTRVCVRCGRCGSVEPRPIIGGGVCVRCGYENDPSAAVCSSCGSPLPKPPGASVMREKTQPSFAQSFSEETDDDY